MRRRFFLLCFLLPFAVNLSAQNSKISFVNPLIGTDGMGHTFPGACAPFGFVQLSPETDTIPQNVNGQYQKDVYAYCAGYQYKDKTIVGFSHTHLSGTGHSDLGDIMIMPTVGPLKLNPGTRDLPGSGYRSTFSHNTEKCSPGYYEVMLEDYHIKAQLTATTRVGVHKYTYPKGKDCRIILDLLHSIYNYDGKVLWSSIRVENDTLLTGYRITDGWARTNYIYFAISFSKPITDYGYIDKQKPKYIGFWRRFNIHKNFPEISGRQIVSYFNFNNEDSQELTVKVALSAVSTEGALNNLQAEVGQKSFETIVEETQQKWEKELATIEATGSQDQKSMIYTSFYHTMINPSIYMDVDRKYRGLDGNIHLASDFDNYTIFSLWDTYRAEHPLLNLLKTDRNTNMVKSMIRHQQQSVHKMLPVWSLMGNEGWCMTGYHAVSVLADAIEKGANVNVKEALKAMVETSKVGYYSNIDSYMKLGYVPFDKNETAASTTLEYAYDDWTIYQTALHAGNNEIAKEYLARAKNYQHVYDPSIGFACPRYSDGTFKKNLDPLQTSGEGFIEGNSWNYSFHVPQDVNGMIHLMGGEKVFLKKLDALFKTPLPSKYYADNEDVTADCLIGGYVHGNEPSHHIPYLYAWTSQPWKTQYWIREIMNNMYRNKINGLGGNDDCGQMSAWYLFTAIGFYPVCPGTDQYVIGAPYVPYIKLNLPNGKIIEIKASKVSDINRYVRSVKLNGKPYAKLYITQKDLINGCTLEFKMGDKPNKKRGLSSLDKPYSLTKFIK